MVGAAIASAVVAAVVGTVVAAVVAAVVATIVPAAAVDGDCAGGGDSETLEALTPACRDPTRVAWGERRSSWRTPPFVCVSVSGGVTEKETGSGVALFLPLPPLAAFLGGIDERHEERERRKSASGVSSEAKTARNGGGAEESGDNNGHRGTFGCNGRYIWGAFSDGTGPPPIGCEVLDPRDRDFRAIGGSADMYSFRARNPDPAAPELECWFVPCFCAGCREAQAIIRGPTDVQSCVYRFITRAPTWPFCDERHVPQRRHAPARRAARRHGGAASTAALTAIATN